jgi:starch phosphorylase
MPGTRFVLEVQPVIPERLSRLTELANDLLYSWDREVRSLFFRLDRDLWETCGHNPKVFLRRVAQDKLETAARDRVFVEDYNRVLSSYDTYHHEPNRAAVRPHLDPDKDLVAYFCAEFGFHESFPIYSGGLGILAGDHCKAASDLSVPFVAVGLLYRQGYFNQTIDRDGRQVAHYVPTKFADLPIEPARNASGEEIQVSVDLPGRTVALKVWRTKAGHITLYLLDSDLPVNGEADRSITYQLYGGDRNTRIQQELCLGIGGVRALRAMGQVPTVWHINEGHAAFQLIERCRELIGPDVDFDTALEGVAAGTVFTTHTPVPAGHDIFEHHLVGTYFADYVAELGIDLGRFLALGTTPTNPHGFNMTTLALRGSRFRNGVSGIHGEVASRMEADIWPQVPPEENPIGHVTNGVHVPTFLAREWSNLFDMRFGGGWRNELLSDDFWQQVDAIPDHSYWSLRQSLKSELLDDVRQRLLHQLRREGCSPAHVERLTRYLKPQETDILVLGFARRFATYKRATLIFQDPERLKRLFNDPERPLLLMFAGKAHPSDQPGQDLIRIINDYASLPEFAGKIILLEGYNIAMARKLVTGVDVWLNNPEYPLEASGTSGQKAGINGVINLSVLDGWWGEGYDAEADNGWAITPHGPDVEPEYRDREEGNELLDLLEDRVIPLYFKRNGHGYPEGWVRKSKASMKTLLPRFNAQRMVMDYVKDFYGPAAAHSRKLNASDGVPAAELATWRRKVGEAWHEVRIRRLDHAPQAIRAGQALPLEVAVHLNGLDAADVVVECLVGDEDENAAFRPHHTHPMRPTDTNAHGEHVFRLDMTTPLSGLQYYKIRVYPYHRLLNHCFETGCMLWL